MRIRTQGRARSGWFAAACLAIVAGSAFAQPSISNITPSNGPTAGGNIVRVQGTGLSATSSIIVGGRLGTVLTATGAELYALCPEGAGGSVSVIVSDMGQISNTVFYSYNPPLVSSVSPATGATSGGAIITVRGQNFGLAPSVAIGGAPSAPTFISHTQILCPLPAGAGANREVVVTTGNQSSSPGRFDYSPPAIVGINPQSVSTGGGTLITITGQNFGVATPQVLVDGRVASVQSSNHTQIVASAPAGDGSFVDVRVVAADQVSPPALLSYQPPTISGIITPPGGTPTSGGVLITIQGSNFGLAPQVTVDGAPTLNTLQTHSLAVFEAPEGTGSEAKVEVRARDQFSNAVLMSYAPPTISGVAGAPVGTTLPSSGGTLLTITGQNFGAQGGKLFVGGLPLTNVQHDPDSPHTRIFAVSPAGLGRGQSFMAVVGDQVGYFGALLHFDMPVCAGDADGDGIVDFDDITSSLANWSNFCP